MDSQNSTALFGLTPLDHTLPKIYISYVLAFKTEDPHGGIETLREGMTRLLSTLPLLGGEVIGTPELNGHRDVHQVHLSRSVSHVDDILTVKSHLFPVSKLPTPTPSGASDETSDGETGLSVEDFVPISPLSPWTNRRSVVQFQANRMTDGVALGMSFHHAVFDGTGAEFVLKALAECCRAFKAGSDAAPLASEFANNEGRLRALINEMPVVADEQDHTSKYSTAVKIADMPASEEEARMTSLDTSLVTSRFSFPVPRIEELRAFCNVYVQHSLGLNLVLSANDVLNALLAISMNRESHAHLAESQGPSGAQLLIAANIRKRFRQSDFQNYLGNAVVMVGAPIHGAETTSPTGPAVYGQDIAQLAAVAAEVRKGVLAVDEKHVLSLLSFMQKQEDWSALSIKLAGTLITSWRHLSVYSMDFGEPLGRINGFEMHMIPIPNLCVILPRVVRTTHMDGCSGRADAPWEVNVTMTHAGMKRFMSDPLLVWASK
ncbi:transferase family-domain-containing protein [Aspergillus taichungensis]|uniref:Transferase family-domain-containing protein n=1 Tax=Aspergillus taichungensis TaxID=482145 RepID=A0A2J5HGW8_9EURO|nr:transferase family-domain-containing protein [Aspergillus taichungensis]